MCLSINLYIIRNHSSMKVISPGLLFSRGRGVNEVRPQTRQVRQSYSVMERHGLPPTPHPHAHTVYNLCQG